MKEGIKVKGIFRVNIVDPDGKIKGDSGWCENQVTNLGIQDYLCDAILGDGGAKSVSHMALGTGGAPASNATEIAGELTDAADARAAVSTSIVDSRTAQFTGNFASNKAATTTHNISNIGLYAVSTTDAGTVFAGNTFASSSMASNQAVNATYQIRFS